MTRTIVPSAGPLDAKIVFIGESPAAEEVKKGIPLVGKSGKLLNRALIKAGIDRASVRVMNLVPVRAPGDKFANHSASDLSWGRELFYRELANLPNAVVYVALGANPTEWLLGRLPTNKRGEDGFIGQWRGSIIPVALDDGLPEIPEDYLMHLPVHGGPSLNIKAVVIPTFHPAAVLRQFTWHPWFMQDVRKAADVARNGVPALPVRKWFWQDSRALEALANSPVDLVSVDTEMDPKIVAIATETEVHVFEWSEAFRSPFTKLMTNPKVLKIAHNWIHDYAWIRKQFGVTVQRPYYDTQGGAQVLNTALQKELSPHIASRFTNWPYHKWLVNIDPMLYCGMDAVVSYDAYWPQLRELGDKGLYAIANHDHKLLTPLMEMQAVGFRVNEGARAGAEKLLQKKLDALDSELQTMVAPVVERKLTKFEKPHLFRVLRKCWCCGGGTTQRGHCYSCYFAEHGAPPAETRETATAYGFKTIKALREAYPACGICNGTGKIVKNLPFNSDSPDQLADVIYRGLGIRARRFKGNVTTKAASLDPIKDKHPIVAKIVEVSGARADLDTVQRLTADSQGLLHCVFDPWGTGSGRVAGKEGLVELGTNPMNIPLEARRLVVPREGKIFLYPDMAQIEARVAAVLSKDKNLLRAFTEPIDWVGNPRHGTIDSHTKVQQLLAEQGVVMTRDQVKRFVYAGIYGGEAPQLTVELNAEAFRKGLSERLTTDEVQTALDTFFRVFRGLRNWQFAVAEEVQRTRQLINPLTGRVFTWPGYVIDTKTKELKHEVRKQAWSRLPQDTAAYVLALGLIDIYYNSPHWGKLLQPLIHVHDAPLIEVPIGEVEFAKAEATRLLTKELWGITFKIDMKQGMDWYAASGGQ